MSFMLKYIKLLLFCSLFFLSCSSKDTSLQGRWVVENISFDFDEKKTTPQMISQFGEMEQSDELVFKNDSMVYVKMLDFDGDFYYKMDEKGNISFVDNKLIINQLGNKKANKIYSNQNTLIGNMEIIFIKE